MVDRVFLKSVEDSCDKALCALGAKRPRSGTRFFEINKDVLCWVGLNQGNHDDFVRINPFVGVHNISLMRLESENDGVKYKKGDYATISVHLGELCPDIEEFKFYEGSSIEDEAERLAQVVYKYGIEFAKRYSTIEELIPELKSKISELGGYPERYVIALYLSNNIDEAKQFIIDCKAQYKIDESIDTQERFDQFSSWFLTKIN
jgi:hypothetical protein